MQIAGERDQIKVYVKDTFKELIDYEQKSGLNMTGAEIIPVKE